MSKEMMKFNQMALAASIGLLMSFSTLTFAGQGLTSLTDEELAAETGQALFNLSYIAPGESDTSNSPANGNIGFYKLGLEAELELNANIKKLQLGCGGVNGANGCDIDIDNFSLSGYSDTSEGRVSSSAVLTNPFIQFAIRNPEMASTREVVGLRLSAENAKGLLTMGTENSTVPNGLNSFSGYMKIGNATGTGYTAPRVMDYASTGNQKLSGRVTGTVFGIPATVPYTSDTYALNLARTPVDLSINGTTVSGSRINSVTLTGTGVVHDLAFSGSLTADAVALGITIPLDKTVTGYIKGLVANIALEENLGLIHKLQIDNPVSLSLQSQQLFWPGADAIANKGWWLAFDDEIDIGNVSPSADVAITNAVLAAVVPPVNTNLDNPRACGDLIFGCIGGSSLDVGEVNLSQDPGRFLNFPLKDLQVAAQDFAPNCYGGLTFC